MDIIANKNIFFSISGGLVLVSIIAIAVFGLRQGIDLAGGTNWRLQFLKSSVSEDELAGFFEELINRQNLAVRQDSSGIFSVRLPSLSEAEHQNYLVALQKRFGDVEEVSFESIGPSVGQELRQRAFWAAGLVLLGISLYVAWAFRGVSARVSSWKYGLITLMTLGHDVIIPAGLLAFLGRRQGVEIDTNFIVALLVIMGFSVHDTIVVFDRIRENLLVYKGSGKELAELINLSVKETLARSINTSLTLVLVLAALLWWGPPVLFYFVLTILVGTVVGTYSSIFVAAPFLTLFQKD